MGLRSRIGLNYGAFRTTILFNDSSRVNVQQMAASAAYEWRASQTLTLSFGAGGLFNGRLSTTDVTTRMGAGAVVSAALSWLAVKQGTYTPFLMVSGSLAFSAVQTPGTPWFAGDIRAAVSAGYTVWQRLTAYLTGRLFGGPVFYNGAVGGDLYHYQVGAGLVLGLPKNFDVSVELVPLGEQRVSAGVGLSF